METDENKTASMKVRDFKAKLREERKKDNDTEKLLYRKINISEILKKEFGEHLKQGKFMESVT